MLYIYDRNLVFVGDTPYSIEILKKTQPQYVADVWYFSEIKIDNPKLVNGKIKEKDSYDLYLDGSYILKEGEVATDGKITYVSKPRNMIRPEWNYSTFVWDEKASKEELKAAEFDMKTSFYNKELIFASKATAEFACLIISPESFEEVKRYMQSIDPYAKAKLVKKAKRPSVFDRYK